MHKRHSTSKNIPIQHKHHHTKYVSSLSVFFPAYNDARSLPFLIARATKAVKTITKDFEIIIVNDGSTDNTTEVIRELRRNYKHLRLVNHKTNRGYGGALITGFTKATKEWVFYTDGDGQYDPMELIQLAKRVSSRTDVINGYKRKRHDPWYRTVIGITYNLFIRILYHPPISDIDCDFRLIRKKCVKGLRLTSQSGAICLELITKLEQKGARFAEIPVNHYQRVFGKSEFFSFDRIIQTIKELPKIPITIHRR